MSDQLSLFAESPLGYSPRLQARAVAREQREVARALLLADRPGIDARAMAKPSPELIAKIFDRVSIALPRDLSCAGPRGPCWNSGHALAGRKGLEYPIVRDGLAFVRVHRAMFAFFVRPLEAGELVLHECDNCRCCNPLHLFAGCHADNMADRDAKGRQARGERLPFSKLNAELVREIRAASGTQVAIGARFGISQMSVSYVLRRKTWAHIA